MSQSEIPKQIQSGKSDRIVILGIGGAGCTVLNSMQPHQRRFQLVACNTDVQSLASSTAETKIQLGRRLTGGLGAGGDPIRGKLAAEESRGELRTAMGKPDLVCILAGLGGGTGSGASELAGAVARASGAKTAAIVTLPFAWEGARRRLQAEKALTKLTQVVDHLLVFPLSQVFQNAPSALTVEGAFEAANEMLRRSVAAAALALAADDSLDFGAASSRLYNEAISGLLTVQAQPPEWTNDSTSSRIRLLTPGSEREATRLLEELEVKLNALVDIGGLDGRSAAFVEREVIPLVRQVRWRVATPVAEPELLHTAQAAAHEAGRLHGLVSALRGLGFATAATVALTSVSAAADTPAAAVHVQDAWRTTTNLANLIMQDAKGAPPFLDQRFRH
ncbi:MAG: hypothetical protein AB7O30_07430 [Dehalococcoidia bacterium]